MLVFSKSIGEKTGNLAVNSYQFAQLAQEREAAVNHQGVNVMKEIADRVNMTEFQLLISAKYPEQKGFTREEYDAVADDYFERKARKLAKAA